MEEEIKKLKQEESQFEERWGKQKQLIKKVREYREQLDRLRLELEKAEKEVRLESAAEVKYGKIPDVKKKLKEVEAQWATIPQEERILREEVTEDDIAQVVSRWTSIPVTRLVKSEKDKLLNLEAELASMVVGQKEALKAVSGAIRRSRAGVAEENRPIAAMMFLGPTGVGKTETARALSQVLFDDVNALIRIDMSEYTERHSVSRLIGAPPGYVGYEEGGQLTEAVRRKPYAVILFDEIEKAHQMIFTIFLQIFDAGRLTDGKGRTVDFRNTVLIMTSNLGGEIIRKYADNPAKPEGLQKQLNKEVWEKIQATFPPEFINRLDQIIMFDSLSKEQLGKIVDLQLAKVTARLSDQDVKIEVSDNAKSYLAQKGYDPVFGARPLKRLIETEILDEIAMLLIENKLSAGDTAKVELDKNSLRISKK